MAINYSETVDHKFINYGCNDFVVFHEFKGVINRFRSLFLIISLLLESLQN